MTFTTTFDRENFLRLPDALYEAWGIEDEDLYAEVRGSEIFLHKNRAKNTVTVVGVFLHSGLSLSPYLIKTAGLRFGHEVVLTLEDDVLCITNTKAIALDSPIVRKALLEKKLQRELAESTGSNNATLLEDIYFIIAYSDWDAEVADSLLRMPDLLYNVALMLGNDDIFSDFYEKRVRDLTLQYVVDKLFALARAEQAMQGGCAEKNNANNKHIHCYTEKQ